MRTVVAQQSVVVAVEQEVAGADLHERGGAGDDRQVAAIRPSDAQPLPVGQRRRANHAANGPAAGVSRAEIDDDPLRRGRRDAHRATPRLVPPPAVVLQVVGDRGEGVGVRGPDVAAAVAVEVDRVTEVARRHELRLAHCPRPGATHARHVDVAARHHRERIVELGSEKGGAPRLPGQRGERLEDGRAAVSGAKPRLDSPQGDNEPGLHPVGVLDPGQERPVVAQVLLAAADHLRRLAPAVVLLEGGDQLGLAPIALHDPAKRPHAREGAAQQLVTEAARACLLEQLVQPLLEGGRGLDEALNVLHGREAVRIDRSRCVPNRQDHPGERYRQEPKRAHGFL